MEDIKKEEGVKKEENLKKEDVKKEEVAPKMRQIIIETDGNDIHLIKAEVSGKIELLGILENLINYINNQKK